MSDEPNNTDLLQAIHALAARFDGLEQQIDGLSTHVDTRLARLERRF